MTINKKLKKINISTIILILIFLVGLSLLLYPTISDYWNSFHQSRAIAKYTEQVAELNNDLYKQLWEDAAAYNERLLTKLNRYKMTSEEKAEYESLLNVSGNGIIGYIEIEKIDCSLPVYHGTAESALQIAAGHIEGTSLPVGGASTHCVISGHRGLPRAKLFTNLDRLVEGDTFELHILDEILTYEVDQISVVEPDEVEKLEIEEGKDYCTLVTCTPYGINTHRLLVRGHRVANREKPEEETIVSETVQEETKAGFSIIPLVPVLIFIILVILLLIRICRRR
ncbi:class C sortase [Frisingicoccus sp.]|uniref:class C sortase n=1 Tax=Frisingicoccus sp. TaxID=1918627 RepID=UPI003AB76848